MTGCNDRDKMHVDIARTELCARATLTSSSALSFSLSRLDEVACRECRQHVLLPITMSLGSG